MKSRPLIKESLRLLNIIGLDAVKQNNFSKFRSSVMLLMIIAMFCDCLLNLLFNWKLSSAMDDIAVAIVIYQVLFKSFTLVLYRGRLNTILANMNQFWASNMYGLQSQIEIEFIHTLVRKYFKWFSAFSFITAILYFVQALTSSVRKLPVSSYFADSYQSPNYELTFALYIGAVSASIIVIIGFDFLFVSLVVNAACELKLLRKGFETIPISDDSEADSDESLFELFKIIDHHNLTLGTIKDIKEMYAMLLLNVFFFDMIIMCSGLLCIIASGFPPSLATSIKYGLFVFTYAFQLFFYCGAGSFLTDQSENISSAVYNVNWWSKTQPKFRRACVMVISRANKVETLSAGGMFDLDLDNFTKIIKTSLSFFTVVKALYGDK